MSFNGARAGGVVLGLLFAGMIVVGTVGLVADMASTWGECSGAIRGEDVSNANDCLDATGRTLQAGVDNGQIIGMADPSPDAGTAITIIFDKVTSTLVDELSNPAPTSGNPLPGGPPPDDDDDIVDDDDATNDDDDDSTPGGTLCERVIANLDRCGLLAGSIFPPDPEDAVPVCDYLITQHPLADELECNFECMMGFPDCADQTDPAVIDLCDDECSQ